MLLPKTVNELVSAIEQRIMALGSFDINALRSLQSGEESESAAKKATAGLSKVDLIALLISEEFSLQEDRAIEGNQ